MLYRLIRTTRALTLFFYIKLVFFDALVVRFKTWIKIMHTMTISTFLAIILNFLRFVNRIFWEITNVSVWILMSSALRLKSSIFISESSRKNARSLSNPESSSVWIDPKSTTGHVTRTRDPILKMVGRSIYKGGRMSLHQLPFCQDLKDIWFESCISWLP